MKDNESNRPWYEREPAASKVAQYRDLASRNQGIWQMFRDMDGYDGIMIADGAVWDFGCQSSPDMITGGPTSPSAFLSQHWVPNAKIIADDNIGRHFDGTWDDIYALVCKRLLSLGFRPSDS